MTLHLLLPALAASVICAAANAQVVADPAAPKGQRPTVMQTANGVTQVNVQTPSAAGVSRNTYLRFDVDGRGVILNNSRTDTATELGGWVQGNPWLARGAARVVLNEVNGSAPSRLAGRIEVAGSRAELVIANPAGIHCNGCGFINASRATLTTGMPVLSEGVLHGFRVQGGALEIEGKGLDARGTDYAALLARAVRVNATIQADQLAVVTGAGEVPAQDPLTPVTPLTPLSGAGPAPRLQLDVAALGGLYARKIFLVGSESGLGVVHAGRAVADDDLVLRGDGWLVQSGVFQAGKDLQVTARGLDNRGGALSASRIQIDTFSGSFMNDAGVIAASDRIGIRAASIDNAGGAILGDGDVQVSSGGPIHLGRGLMAAGRNLQVEGSELSVARGGSLWSEGTLQLRVAGRLANAGEVGAGSTLTASAGDIDNAQGASLTGSRTSLNASGTFTNRGLVDGASTRIDARQLLNIGTGRLYGDLLAIGADTLTNDSETLDTVRADAVIAGRERLDIGVRQLMNREHALIFSAGTGADALTLGGALDAAGRATGQAEQVINSSATIESLGDLRIDAQRLENRNAHFDTERVKTLGPTARSYIQPEGRSKLPAELFVWEGWSRAGRYRYRTDPAAGSGGVLGQSPVPRVGEQSCSGDEDQEVCTRLPGADYLAGDPAWAYFGLPAPEPAPAAPTLRKPEAPDAARAGTCEAGPAHDPIACTAYRDDLGAYQSAQTAYTQAWSDHEQRHAAWLSETDERYARLDDRIEAYNAGFAGSVVQNWTQYHVTRTEYETRVLSSDPGRILSGGDMHLVGGDLINDKSQIVAGGALTGDLAHLRTVEAEGVRIVSEWGTSQYTASRWRGGAKRYHQRDWSGVAPYTPADEVISFVLPVSQRRSHAGTPAAAGSGLPIPDRTSVVTIDPAGHGGTRIRTLAASGAWPLPASSLFRPAADATAPYFIETDPRFTDRLAWQRQQGPDASPWGKRLGDAYFEQQMVRDQVLQLTGRRLLAGHTSDASQYQVLVQAGETYAQAHELRPGVALTAAQMAQLTSDMVWLVLRPVTLPDGRTVQALVPQVYVTVRPGDLDDAGTLLAGESVDLRLSGDLDHAGTIAGRKSVVIDAQSIRSLGGRLAGRDVDLRARDDIEVIGGQVHAQRSLSLQAGQDFTLASTTRTQEAHEGASRGERTQIDRMAGLYVTDAGGTLLARAGRDLTLKAAQVMNASPELSEPTGPTVLLAGRDFRLDSVEVSHSTGTVWDARNFQHEATRRDAGAHIQVQGDLVMAAGRDLGAKAARIESTQGSVSLHAGQDVVLAAGQTRDQRDEARHMTQRGTLSSRTRTTHDTVDATQAVGTTVSGDAVQIGAGRDLTVQASQIVSTQGTALLAGRDVTLDAVTESRSERHERQETRRGVFSSGGVGFTVGRREVATGHERVEKRLTPSTVGSTEGSVVIEAGAAYRQAASEVLAPQGDVSITGREIAVVEGQASVQSVDRAQVRQSGVTVAVTNPVITALQTADQMARAAADTRDPRMRALAAATAALAAKRAVEAVKAQPETAGGVGVSVTVGSARSETETLRSAQEVAASRVVAGGDLSVRAEGAGEQSGLTVRGSQLQAGADVLLAAEGDIAMLGAARRTGEHSTQRSAGASVGFGMTWDGKDKGGAPSFGVMAHTNAARGASQGEGTQWQNAQVQAAGRISLESGENTVLRGAVVQGEQVVVRAGSGLAMESPQDTETFRSREQSVSAGVTVGANVTGSLSLGKSQIDSTLASTSETTALRAGDGGFDVRVQGDTALKGAVITSTDAAVAADRNRFESGGLSLQDIENHAHYQGTGAGVSFGAGKDPRGKLSAQGTGGGYGRDGQSVHSVTRSGVSGVAGDSGARTTDAPTGLRSIFDVERVRAEIQARVTITSAMGVEARKAIQAYAAPRKADLRKRIKAAEKSEEAAALRDELKRVEREERVMNILVGAVTAQGGASLAREALGAASKEMRELMIEDSRKFKGVTDGVAELSNQSGRSVGVDGDEFKLGGARVSLELVCGEANQRCERSKETGEFILTKKQMIHFKAEPDQAASLDDFLKTEQGRKMAGVTGGVQGAKGTLYGVPYAPGSWIDALVESFAGAHDMIGGKIVGVYDSDGNIKRSRGTVVGRVQDYWSLTGAVVVSSPFAMATLLPPDVWNAISILLKASR